MPFDSPFDEALVIDLPVIIKASSVDGRRLVEVEASNECVDSEGDVILQCALLNSAREFLRSGALDIDHFSEIGARMGIANPSDFIVGNPVEVKDLGGGRTSVVGELHQPTPGRVTKADELWDNLMKSPPVRYRASIYGFPPAGGYVDARVQKCAEAPGARRYVVKALDWKSLAFTRNPINTAIEGAATIVSAKSHIARMMKLGFGSPEMMKDMGTATPPSMSPGDPLLLPRNRMELQAHHTHHVEKGHCPFAGTGTAMGKSVASYREHFKGCCGADHGTADMLALALMHSLKHDKPLGYR